jgi:hypothetical protein
MNKSDLFTYIYILVWLSHINYRQISWYIYICAGRCRPVPGRTSEGAPGGRPVPVAGQCRWPAGAGCRPVPVAGRCRLPAGAGWES